MIVLDNVFKDLEDRELTVSIVVGVGKDGMMQMFTYDTNGLLCSISQKLEVFKPYAATKGETRMYSLGTVSYQTKTNDTNDNTIEKEPIKPIEPTPEKEEPEYYQQRRRRWRDLIGAGRKSMKSRIKNEVC